jgi:hypothetical protein
MPKYVCRLTGYVDDDDTNDNDGHELIQTVCCVVHADTLELAKEALPPLLRQLHASAEVYSSVRQLYLDDVFELPDDRGNTVLWTEDVVHRSLPLADHDNADGVTQYERGLRDIVADDEPDEIVIDPFIVFDDPIPPG